MSEDKGECPVVGVREIAAMIGTSYAYVNQLRVRASKYRQRALIEGSPFSDDWMPEEDWLVSGRPVWLRESIAAWAERMGRLQTGS